MDTQSCYIYNAKEFIPFLEGASVSPLMKSKPSSEPIPIPDGNLPAVDLDNLSVADTLYCSYCTTGFADRSQQREHYKLDWHRYNLKQFLASKKTISEEKFAQLADDVSSISGSESESETETELSSTDVEAAKDDDARLTHLIARRSRVLFNNTKGEVISVHRAVLLHKKDEVTSDDHLIDLINKLPYRTKWLIVMMGGGHFAAAIFQGEEPIMHKTFHSYTVRSKQGGSQSSKDGKGSHPKSAGASLRRYNEQSFSQHIQDLMKAWAPDIVKCDLIFYRAVGRSNSGVLFSGPQAPLLRSDPRLRTIPFPTRRATFNEVKRVHGLLSTAFIYDSNEMFKTTFSQPSKDPAEVEKKWPKCGEGSPKGSPKKQFNRAKERPSPVRELPELVQQLAAVSTSGSEGDFAFVEGEHSFVDALLEYEDTVPQHVKDRVNKRKTKKKKKETDEDVKNHKEELRPEVEKLWKAIHSSCHKGNIEDLQNLLENKNGVTNEEVALILNQKNILGETLLHNMAAQAKCDALRLLMLNGADPTIKDKKSQTAYDHAPDKVTRNVFRRFMGDFPEMYVYSKSHIPNALTEELEAEIAEKKKLAKKAKRQKDKERRQAVETMKKEDYEKKCFLNLSDREKRALAAERRILAKAGKQGVVLSRCFSCAIDITGKTLGYLDAVLGKNYLRMMDETDIRYPLNTKLVGHDFNFLGRY